MLLMARLNAVLVLALLPTEKTGLRNSVALSFSYPFIRVGYILARCPNLPDHFTEQCWPKAQHALWAALAIRRALAPKHTTNDNSVDQFYAAIWSLLLCDWQRSEPIALAVKALILSNAHSFETPWTSIKLVVSTLLSSVLDRCDQCCVRCDRCSPARCTTRSKTQDNEKKYSLHISIPN